jgi:hypothetical protein
VKNAWHQNHSASGEILDLERTALCFPLRLCILFIDEKGTCHVVPEIIYVSCSPARPGFPLISESSSLSIVSGIYIRLLTNIYGTNQGLLGFFFFVLFLIHLFTCAYIA